MELSSYLFFACVFTITFRLRLSTYYFISLRLTKRIIRRLEVLMYYTATMLMVKRVKIFRDGAIGY